MTVRVRFATALAFLTVLVDIGLARLAELGGPYRAHGFVGGFHLAGNLDGTFAAPKIIRRIGIAGALGVAQVAPRALLIDSPDFHSRSFCAMTTFLPRPSMGRRRPR